MIQRLTTGTRWAVLPVVLVVWWLGVRGLNADILWFDEGQTLLYAGAPTLGTLTIGDIWQVLASENPWHVPAYFIALKGWASLVGWSDAALRAFSLLTGILVLPLTYRLGRDVYSHRVGLIAVCLLAGSSTYIYYLHEMRPYTPHVLLVGVVAVLYWRIHRRDYQHPGWYITFSLSIILLAYTHLMALLSMLGIGLYHLLFVRKNRQWWYLTGAMVAAALAFLPWIDTLLHVMSLSQADIGKQLAALYGLTITDEVLHAFSNGNSGLLLLLLVPAFVYFQNRLRWWVIWLIVALATMTFLNEFFPVFIHVRYLLALWIVLALLTAVGIVRLHERGLPVWLSVGIWLIIGVPNAWTPHFHESLRGSWFTTPRDDFIKMVETVETHSTADDLIVLHTAPPTQEWSTGVIHSHYLVDVRASVVHLEAVQPVPLYADEATYRRASGQVLQGVDNVYTAVLPFVETTRRSDVFFDQLQRSHHHCHTFIDTTDMQFQLYAHPEQSAVAGWNNDAVAVIAPLGLPDRAQDTVSLLLGWRRDASLPPDTYSVGLHLMDDSEQLVAQADYGLPNDPFACRQATLDLTALPSGMYTLSAVVYNWQTGAQMESRADLTRIQVGGTS